MRQIGAGQVKMLPRSEMLDLVVVDGHARGIVARDLVTGKIETARRRRRGARHRRLRQRLLPRRRTPRAATSRRSGAPTRRGAAFANPCYTQIHPTCIPVTGDHQSKLTLMTESLRNDGRIWVPKKRRRQPARRARSPRPSATTTSSASTRASATSPRATSPRARPRRSATRAAASARAACGVYLDFADAIKRLGAARSREQYGNLFDMYERITGENAVRTVPMRIYPAVALHDGRAVGGLQPDEHHPRPVRARRGELLRPRRQPPRRQRADAGPGRRLLRPPLHDRQLPRLDASSRRSTDRSRPSSSSVEAEVAARIAAPARRSRASRPSTSTSTASSGKIMWDHCGMAPQRGRACETALAQDPGAARGVLAERQRARRRTRTLNQSPGAGRPRRRLPRVRRAACAATRSTATSPAAATSARSTSTPTARRKRDDDNFCHVAAWEYTGDGPRPPTAQRRAARVRERPARSSAATSESDIASA